MMILIIHLVPLIPGLQSLESVTHMTSSHPAPAISNFGGNQRFTPTACLAPKSELELLEILRTHRGQRIRAVGRLHSWSAAPVTEGVVIDCRHLTRITVHDDPHAPSAEVEAGCQIKHIVQDLQRRGYTLPSLGLIQQQSIAGATATATHGSGRNCLSYYIQSARLATYDPVTGEPVIRFIDSGDELRAIQCGLGCLGIITSLRMTIRRQYQIEECFYRHNTLPEVLARETEFPLQQFYLVPWRWDYYGQHRREVDRSRSGLAWLYRLYWGAGIDVALHVIVKLLARWLPRFCTRFFFSWLLPCLIPQGWKVVDRSDRQLTMHHELFRHIEIELFVRASQLAPAMDYVIWMMRHAAGERLDPPAAVRERLQGQDCQQELERLHGVYQHHYPVCIRKVLPDDMLLSMSSASEACYAISIISYAHPAQREGFFKFANLLASTMAELFDARPHWGKYCPLTPAELRRLYPHLTQFTDIARNTGSPDVFANDWLRSILT